ncbi:MAG TPA: hypothetical protein VJH23_02260 [archaeon]|nr:hypothetical protein [archaeon]
MELKVKKWGNSMAVIIPDYAVKEKKLAEDDSIFLDIVKKADFSEDFGKLKHIKSSGQKIKDFMKKGWE